MKSQRSEIEYGCIREGFVDGFMNAYNLVSTELVKMQNSEVNAVLERIFDKAPVREVARQQADKHVAILTTAKS
jgi:hypothetical protein